MGFNSHEDFHRFERHVRFERRYLHTKEAADFLEALGATLQERSRSLKKGSFLFRSQIGFDEEDTGAGIEIVGYSPSRMKPTRDVCGEGRANPRGIPYLYLANDRDTCIAEMRPQRAEWLSVAQFEIQRDLKLVDCYSVKRQFGNLELLVNPPTDQAGIQEAVWSEINNAFNRPVSRSDTSADYVPTQILAEYFLANGFDGICYKSGLGPGFNIVLFDLAAAEVVNCFVYSVTSVTYTFSEITNGYFVSKK